MSAQSFASSFLRARIAQTLSQAGFEKVTSSASSLLTELLIRYLDMIAKRSMLLACLSGRTKANTLDVSQSLQDLGIDIESLEDFCSEWLTPLPSNNSSSSSKKPSGSTEEPNGANGQRSTSNSGSSQAMTKTERLISSGPASFPIDLSDIKSDEPAPAESDAPSSSTASSTDSTESADESSNANQDMTECKDTSSRTPSKDISVYSRARSREMIQFRIDKSPPSHAAYLSQFPSKTSGKRIQKKAIITPKNHGLQSSRLKSLKKARYAAMDLPS